eukprot:CAMPEP_0183710726 /NCGR_PEP_ID=MMETSP0737-20130205/6391_1 /TAXON_ID=385413 /ORGANISM="Thalassiosira miniscula, Strain CCMP1093" /LENGTH=56 /DNA_ID=CAMNT_0025939055 /DNA_START=77 /DNA_END=243 /DNA_ORIENTATION=-
MPSAGTETKSGSATYWFLSANANRPACVNALITSESNGDEKEDVMLRRSIMDKICP